MSADILPARNTRFRFAWITLLIVAGLMALLHFTLMFALTEPVLFLGFGVFNIYALLIIWIPFRKGERWAWFATWLLPIGLAVPAAFDRDIASFYFAVAAICLLGLLLTMRRFFVADPARTAL